jgi:hypothetical protein
MVERFTEYSREIGESVADFKVSRIDNPSAFVRLSDLAREHAAAV